MSKKISQILAHHGKTWIKDQKIKIEQRIKLKLENGRKAKYYSRHLLQYCKTLGGPCAPAGDFQEALKQHPGIDNVIVKTEMAYFAHTHKADKIARPELYRLNGISHD